MSDSEKKIKELQAELAQKEAELAHLRLRLTSTNSRLEKVVEEISQEVKMASQVQRLLSPIELPHIQGFEFSTKFIPGVKSGGDYFDIFEHEDRLKFGIVLTASSGYTMSALFLSILMKISSRLEARRGLDPQEMIATITRELQPGMKLNDKASVFYGVVDRRNFELSYCSIGEISGFLQVNGSDVLQRLESQGPLLSKSSTFEPQTLRLPLNPRDRILLCSEGVTKSTNSVGQLWGESGLSDAILSAPRHGVHELRNEILYRGEEFSGKKDPERDQTVLVLEVKDKVIKLAKN